MALAIQGLQRMFIIKGGKDKDIELSDPNPALSPDEVVKLYSGQYPQLTSAKIAGPRVEGKRAVYTASLKVGTKG